ncbi:ATP-dependent Clp protease ATP-binding subunit [Sulfidibacter corallicola]|uniref:ATP-dependent Clp protease ATP-binding subunit n=1 Tax=Sulfidibacter corallicola TaxID=2818388 RepID=A0A8A4TLN0_SULCO|nr:AAA family ATPase [Sulfidibacter corallicola]QTD50866.1 ATP-dependent Clp protease ATP-binding subunit [Sulfidibacter corallicola]
MSVTSIPVLYWQERPGMMVAVLIQTIDMHTAVAESAKKAKEQLQALARHLVDEGDELDSIEKPELRLVPVSVRPSFVERESERIFPCSRKLRLNVAVVVGSYRDLRFASLPALDLSFYYVTEDDLPALVEQAVQQKLGDRDPGRLARLFCPEHIELDRILVHTDRESKHRPLEPPPELGAVAEPIRARSFRRTHGNAWGRESCIADLIARLGTEGANVLLLGPAGCGKTTVLTHAVKALELRDRDEDDEDDRGPRQPRHWMTRPGRIMAGMSYLGEWEQRCERLVEELGDIEGVLCVDDLLDLVRLGAEEPNESLAAFFQPYLAEGELRMVVETTAEGLQACRRLLPGFVDLFQILRLPDLGARDRREILRRSVEIESQRHRCKAAEGIDTVTLDLFGRFQPYHRFPADPTAFVANSFAQAKKNRLELVEGDFITERFMRHTGLPRDLVDARRPLSWDAVFSAFRGRVLGQDPACEAVADVVTTFKAGMNDITRPLGVFLFCGPTGVGKTELAKTLADYLFGHGEKGEDRLIRVDMSEYAYPGSAARLQAKPDGQPSELVTRIRRHPFSVVLFDEIEKAAADVFDLLLNVLDEGHLTDIYGRRTNFRSAIIIMTSNLGAGKTASVGFGEGAGPSYTREAMKFFRPEFVNRIDHIVSFEPLSRTTIEQIAALSLRSFATREGLKSRELTLSWNAEVISFLADRGTDVRYGARPLQRALEREIVTPVSRFLVELPDLTQATLALVCSGDRIEVDWH